MIQTREQHIAEAQRILDGLKPLIFAATTTGIPMPAVPAGVLVLGCVNSHLLAALALGSGPVDPAVLAAAHDAATVAAAAMVDAPQEPPASHGGRLLAP